MLFDFEERPSDSPFVETIWRNNNRSAGSFTSMAISQWSLVVTKHQGKMTLTVRGPETKATPAYCPEDAEHFGIIFKFGTFMSHLPAKNFVDRDANLPEASSKSFWLNGSAWQFPDYDTADTFINWLVRDGLLVREPVVEAALHGQVRDLSLRSAQRRFLRATGLTQGSARQIERARYATTLLQQGVSILDTTYEVGYFDQSHLTTSLKYFIGQTPAQIYRQNNAEQLSFLSKTAPPFLSYDANVRLTTTGDPREKSNRINVRDPRWLHLSPSR